jgi:hypothetical protein
VFGLVAESVAWITGIGIDLSKKTYFSSLSYVMGLAVTGMMMWALIKPFGIMGVAYGMMAGRIAQAVSYTIFAYRVYPLRFACAIPCAVLLLTLFLGIAMQMVSLSSQVYNTSFRILLLTLLAGVIWLWAISAEERAFFLRKCKAFFRQLGTAA